MKCSVCQCVTTDPFIIYDKGFICSYICSNRNPEGHIPKERIKNWKDFDSPLPVMNGSFMIKTNKEIQNMTNIERAKYEQELEIQVKKNPRTIDYINLINLDDDDYDYDSSSTCSN
tara:strand:+ start:196 stop:543 length:348 start_codon:yes stop_codon:yes gene_type:complete